MAKGDTFHDYELVPLTQNYYDEPEDRDGYWIIHDGADEIHTLRILEHEIEAVARVRAKPLTPSDDHW